MKPHGYSDEGIVLARRNFGEADRLLIVFSKNNGKVPLLAKGVRKPKSRKRGHIEVFNRIKFQTAKTHGIDIITEAESIDNFEDLRIDLKKISVAYYFSEVIGRVMHDLERNIDIYELLSDYLTKLETSVTISSLRKEFLADLLVELGFWPRGRSIPNPDQILEEVVERKINSVRVGKKMLQ